jgi:hypothetical protein
VALILTVKLLKWAKRWTDQTRLSARALRRTPLPQESLRDPLSCHFQAGLARRQIEFQFGQAQTDP